MRYSLNGKYAKEARAAVLAFLRRCGDKPPMLYTVVLIADSAIRELGAKHNFGKSIWDYQDLIPGGYTIKWLTCGGDSIVHVVKAGVDLSKQRELSLLMAGPEPLREATMQEVGND